MADVLTKCLHDPGFLTHCVTLNREIPVTIEGGILDIDELYICATSSVA